MSESAESRFFYVSDEGPRRYYPTLEQAKEDADEQINIFRDNCDPEWDLGVEEIEIYECAAETDEPEEDGRCVLTATMINEREPGEDDAGGVDFYCDYAMLPPSDAKAAIDAGMEQDQ